MVLRILAYLAALSLAGLIGAELQTRWPQQLSGNLGDVVAFAGGALGLGGFILRTGRRS